MHARALSLTQGRIASHWAAPPLQELFATVRPERWSDESTPVTHLSMRPGGRMLRSCNPR
jgi:hypothetical protein